MHPNTALSLDTLSVHYLLTSSTGAVSAAHNHRVSLLNWGNTSSSCRRETLNGLPPLPFISQDTL